MTDCPKLKYVKFVSLGRTDRNQTWKRSHLACMRIS